MRENLSNSGSDKTDLVVDAYRHAMLASYPMARYVVGGPLALLYIGDVCIFLLCLEYNCKWVSNVSNDYNHIIWHLAI